MGSASPFTTCRIGFYKTYVPALLPGSSLADRLATSDAIPPLPACMERRKEAAGQCLQSDSFQMDLFARSVTSSQSVHRSNKCLPAKTLTIASKQRVSQTWDDSSTKWVPSCANPLTRYNLEQSCKHCFGNVPLELCVMGCSKSARQLR